MTKAISIDSEQFIQLYVGEGANGGLFSRTDSETGESRAVHIIGAPGVAKSATVEQVLPRRLQAKHGVEVHTLTFMLNVVESTTLNGFTFPVKHTDDNGKTTMRTTTSLPEIVSLVWELTDEGKYVILFFDERGQAPMDVQKAVAPIILSKRIGQHYLGDNVRVISASNRMSDRSGTIPPPMHLINREVQYNWKINRDGYKGFLEGKKVPGLAVVWAMNQGAKHLFNGEVPAEPVPFCTPRSFYEAIRDVEACFGRSAFNEGAADNALIRATLSGAIGPDAANDFVAYLSIAKDMWTWEQIVLDPANVPVPPGRPDTQLAYGGMVVSNIDHQNSKEAFIFITECLPKEMQTAILQTCVKVHGGHIINAPGWDEWVRENRAMLRASNGQ